MVLKIFVLALASLLPTVGVFVGDKHDDPSTRKPTEKRRHFSDVLDQGGGEVSAAATRQK
jgi:hypothetical protein